MKKFLTYFLTLVLILFLSACNRERSPLKNPNFENNRLNGWTILEGNAFTVSQDTYYDLEKELKYYQQGKYYLTSQNGDTGIIKSNSFTLAGNGNISFLIGAGTDLMNTYVALVDAKTDEELIKISNTLLDDPLYDEQFLRLIVDASDYLGNKLYLKIVDNSTDAHINIDDFQLNYSNETQEYLQKDALFRLGMGGGNILGTAQRYIEMNKWKMDSVNRMKYHVMGEIGWINDPNGFSVFKDDYHLFYQFHPYSTSHGPMHWGHVKSDDLIKWEYQPVALAPDTSYDVGGVFSGSAIEKDGKLYVMYTGNLPDKQVQALASSEDGVTFTKLQDNPVINSDLVPVGASTLDIRDPKIWEKNGIYYAAVGSRQTLNGNGQILIFRSTDLVNWSKGTPILRGDGSIGRMWECPDLFSLRDQITGQDIDVLMMSPQDMTNHRNGHGTAYMIGKLDYSKLNYTYSSWNEIDWGFDFYAPQTTIDKSGRRIMVAWMQSWNRRPVMAQYGWAGAMTLPRELMIENGQLIQKPVVEIENYRENFVEVTNHQLTNSVRFNNINGQSTELIVTLEPSVGVTEFGVNLFVGENGEKTRVYYNNLTKKLVFDRTSSVIGVGFPIGDKHRIIELPLDLINGKLELRMFLDRFSVELFVNGGRKTITSTVNPSLNANGIEFFSFGQSTKVSVKKWDIVVK